MELNSFEWPGVMPTADVVLTNLGKSPAMKVEAIIFMRAMPPDLAGLLPPTPMRVQIISADGKTILGQNLGRVIGPSVDYRTTLTERIDEQQSIGLAHGSLRIYVRGTIIYDDLFGESHSTEFCYVSRFPKEPDILAPRLMNCSFGNYAK